jgi:hypothetical protein
LRKARDRQAIRAVGRDLERDQHVVEIERGAQRHPGLQRGVERQQSARVLVDAELLRGAQHALRFDAAHRGALDRESAGQHGAFQGHRREHAGGGVRRTADDLELLGRAYVDDANAQAIGVGMLRQRIDAADDYAVERRRGGNRLLDLEPGHREPLAQLRAVDARIAHRAQPAFGELHANCLRNLKSFS